jgi:hypothetical protein
MEQWLHSHALQQRADGVVDLKHNAVARSGEPGIKLRSPWRSAA